MGDVGGKGSSLVWLRANKFKVPPFLAFEGHHYMEHLAVAGLAIDDLRTLNAALVNQKGTSLTKAEEKQLKDVRDKIMAQPLATACGKQLSSFVSGCAGAVSVRSSASNEDGHDTSFAGQYDTILNCKTPDQVANAVRSVWASAWCPAVFLYRRSRADKVGTQDPLPSMALVVQQMVDSVISGVAFSANMDDLNHALIEACYGLGVGLVDAQVTPDHLVVHKTSYKITERTIGSKEKKFVSNDNGDVSAVDVSPDRRSKCCLSDTQITHLVDTIKRIEDAKDGQPQDVEWAIDSEGELWILQTRDITTIDMELARIAAKQDWTPPEPGSGTLDTTHFAKRATPLLSDVYSPIFAEQFRYGLEACGSFLDHLNLWWVNGYCYVVPRPVGAPKNASGPPPWLIFKVLTWVHPGLRARYHQAAKYWDDKIYLDQLRMWDQDDKPRRIRETLAIIDEIKAIGKVKWGADYQDLFTRLYDNYKDGIVVHHKYSITATMLPAHFCNSVAQWTKGDCSITEALEATMAASAPTRGASDTFFAPFITKVRNNNKLHPLFSKSGQDASAAVATLRKEMAGDKDWVHFEHIFGWRGTNYDTPMPAIFEDDTILYNSIKSAVLMTPDKVQDIEKRSDKLVQAIKAKVPSEHHELFDITLSDVVKMYRLRDERSLYGDLWSCGVLRQFLRDLASRLKFSEDLIMFANEAQIHRWMSASSPAASVITDDDRRTLQEYSILFHKQGTDHPTVPRALGPASAGPPPVDWFPGRVRQTEEALATALFSPAGVFGAPPGSNPAGEDLGPDAVCGIIASRSSVVKAKVTVMKDITDSNKMADGDILVCGSTSSSFNAVIGRASGIISASGGSLCHAAICAREIGIPAIVGCGSALFGKVKDGDTVELNTSTGVAKVIKRA